MAENTVPSSEQFDLLRREVEETKWLTFTLLQMRVGKQKADKALADLQEWLNDPLRRFGTGTPVYEVAARGMAYTRLMEADLYTLEEVAAKPRAEVAAIKGVGRATMRCLDGAMAERGLNYAEKN